MKPLSILFLLFLPAVAAAQETVVLDDFETVDAWSAHPADGVEVTIGQDEGVDGKSMRLDIRFVKGGGYAVVRRPLPLTLPANYRFRFQIRGEIPVNDLEFKLIAPDTENVWWRNQRAFEFPVDWTPVSIRKRHIEFAWGPSGGGEMQEVGSMEFAITAGNGGEGTVWIDQLVLETLPEQVEPPAPVASASSEQRGFGAAGAVDGDAVTAWRPRENDAKPALDVDLGIDREFGGLVITWEPQRHAVDYDVMMSRDGTKWLPLREVRESNGGRDPLLMTESEARAIRVKVLRAAGADGIGLADLAIQPIEWGESRETFFKNLAADAPRGDYPRAYLNEQSYWTVVGADADPNEALIDEDARIEAGSQQFSIEPFIHRDGRLLTWSDAETSQGLAGDFLPLPWTRRTYQGLELTVQALSPVEAGKATLTASYAVRNTSSSRMRGTLYLALRPFQVNPPQQALNVRGGVARVGSIERSGSTLIVDGVPRVRAVTKPSGFGATTFDAGDVVEHLHAGRLPEAQSAVDPFGHASAALAYGLDLAPEEEFRATLVLSLDPGVPVESGPLEAATAAEAWSRRLAGAEISLPDAEVARTLNAQIGWILVNRDGPSIQPGSRAYARSWIRDGSLTSTALLRVGQHETVREFIEWFAPYQYDDGKVPCCVDWRGSDPVPEHDSSGQLIYLIAEYVRHTGDRDMAERMWPRVAGAVHYLDSLRQTRRTSDYENAPSDHFFGLLPPSISHEGYSAKPMHSYWDDLFALRGFKDAVYLAAITGRDAEASRIATIRDQFGEELRRSIERAMEVHGIVYVPGAADLGDFDATSTTIAFDPVDAEELVSREALGRTFERYWEFFRDRRDGTRDWIDMTPYEIRNVGAFVRLGWRERANELLDWFMTLRRPPDWAHWAEVVVKDPRTPRFLGDMPHTWVGSDFVRSVLDMLAYEGGERLVIGAGAPFDWVEGDGITVRRLSTSYGELNFTIRADGEAVEVRIEALPRMPAEGITVAPPSHTPFGKATVDGEPAGLASDGAVTVRRLPATVRFSL